MVNLFVGLVRYQAQHVSSIACRVSMGCHMYLMLPFINEGQMTSLIC